MTHERRSLSQLARRLHASRDTALALELFDAALRAGATEHLRSATAALVADTALAASELRRCTRRMLDCGADPDCTRRMLLGLIERGEEVTLRLGAAFLELTDIVMLVDRPSVDFVEPVGATVAWDPVQRQRLLLRCAHHVLGLFETMVPDDRRPREILDSVAHHWQLDEDVQRGRPGRRPSPSTRPPLTLDEAWALADAIPSTQGGADDIGWGLRYMIEGQATRALESFREMRGIVAHARVWRCYERDGETLVREPDDPLLQRAIDQAHDAEAAARLHDHEMDRVHALDDELTEIFGALAADDEDDDAHHISTRALAAAEARVLTEDDELHWQIDQILRALLT